MHAPLRWDLFCRVVDNFGDLGVCWRLARDLAARGQQVRLWVDDPRALAWMAPGGAAGVRVGGFDGAGPPGDVVVEAFGCDPPAAFVAAMAGRGCIWINLEYLSAEGYVERSHGLPSPQRDGTAKWFFYPGFTAATGGLLREPQLLAERSAFDRAAWLAGRGLAARPGERVVTLFCYANAAVPALLQTLAESPTLLLLAPGPAQQQAALALAGTPRPGLRTVAMPWLSQPDFDRLLWAGDINFVRGEDSLVRAIWAGAPFVWQAYPQQDGAHAAKVQALLAQMPPVPGLAPLWAAWNGLSPRWPGLPEAAAWGAACLQWRERLAARPDLATALQAFVGARRPAPRC